MPITSLPSLSIHGWLKRCIPIFLNSSETLPPFMFQGDRATKVLEDCREKIADFIGANPKEIIFTSGATESNNLALIRLCHAQQAKRQPHYYLTKWNTFQFTILPNIWNGTDSRSPRSPWDQYARVDPHKIESRITEKTILASIGYGSNEVGTLQPMEEICRRLKERGVAVHTDAVGGGGPGTHRCQRAGRRFDEPLLQRHLRSQGARCVVPEEGCRNYPDHGGGRSGKGTQVRHGKICPPSSVWPRRPNWQRRKCPGKPNG